MGVGGAAGDAAFSVCREGGDQNFGLESGNRDLLRLCSLRFIDLVRRRFRLVTHLRHRLQEITEHSSAIGGISRYFPELTERCSAIRPKMRASSADGPAIASDSGIAFRYFAAIILIFANSGTLFRYDFTRDEDS
ncbi:hypothetical protein SD70_12215 [Gordoniibacillus kamchatkensis]|uniref:Uncharacterized protein n=1 Tax=Gordoniibacillus kamchatkensis TaxID=1590651 RepID=A0ABR5AI21_9BACL|nr:hypothetical protein SD70_12215 [Paenibacillus sp. VKM B-2647]